MPSTAYSSITRLKAQLGEDLVILGHHYQSDAVIEHTDITGDSLELARKIPGLSAKHIVFCGVRFMAESAALLAQPQQRVYLPEPSASCVMARTAPAKLVERVLASLGQGPKKVIPLAYVNSTAAIKALCGRYGGSVCTSANAPTMLSWALDQGDQVLFLPDRNLGQNTAHQLGLLPRDWQRLNIRGQGERLDLDSAQRSRLLLWPGLCAVHARFHLRDLQAIRRDQPQAKIVVHPECHPEVVQAADAAGSTSFIIRYVTEAEPGSIVYIGTECHLVRRLKERFQRRLSIRLIQDSPCSNMAKTTAPSLASLLSRLPDQALPVSIAKEIQGPAVTALKRMLRVCN